MLLTIVVLTPKANFGKYLSIKLLKVIWKLIERVLDKWMSGIEVHGCLHGFRAKYGCRTGIIEASSLTCRRSTTQWTGRDASTSWWRRG
jgi:hypothetical protein